MGVFKDITGQRFGRLEVLKRASRKGMNGEAYWLCRCDCGNTKTIVMSSLMVGKARSCGCLRREMLQNSRHKDKRLYQVWQDMKQRCYNPNNAYYHRYGERGITVCEKWISAYDNFYDWAINSGYTQGLYLDRINNNENYTPENCRWATPKESTDNRSRTYMVTHKGKTQSLSDWSRELGIALTTLRSRYEKGLTGAKLLKPPQKKPITLFYNGETKRLTEWCKELNVSYHWTKAQYYKGKSPEEIFNNEKADK